MSVINQMLRDLDARQASKQEREALPGKLRTLPPTRKAGSSPWRVLVGGMVAGGAIAWLVVSQLEAPRSASVPPAAANPTPAPVAQPPVVETPLAEHPVSVPAAEPAAGTAAEGVAPSVSEMKIETRLTETKSAEKPKKTPAPTTEIIPASRAPAPLVPAETISKPVAKSLAEPRGAAAASPVARATPAAPVAEPGASIDKKSKGGQGRDLAESEYQKGLQSVRYGDNAGAAQALQQALEHDPGYAKARQALLSVLVNGKQWAEAQRIVTNGLSQDPTQSGWALILARLQFEQGDTTAALDTLGRYAPHATGDADYQGLFAYLLQKQQRPAEAAQRFQAALALRPQEGRWWFGLGLALEGAGKRNEAKEAFARARETGNLPSDMAQVVDQRLR